MNFKILKSFKEIDIKTTNQLIKNKVKYSKHIAVPNFEKKLALKKFHRFNNPNLSDAKSFEIITCLSKGWITESEANEALSKMSTFSREYMLKRVVANKSNPNISNFENTLRYILDIKPKNSKWFSDEIINLKIKARYFPEEYDQEVGIFFDQNKDQFIGMTWQNFAELLTLQDTPNSQRVILDVLEKKFDKKFHSSISVKTLIELFEIVKTNFPNQTAYNVLGVPKSRIDNVLYFKNYDDYGISYLDGYENVFQTNKLGELLDLNIEGVCFDEQGRARIKEHPLHDTPGHFLTCILGLENLGYYIYNTDWDQEYPIWHQGIFAETFQRGYQKLGMEVHFWDDYDFVEENGKPKYALYHLYIQRNSTQYEVSFEIEFGGTDVELFIALNNRILEEVNSNYRFLQLNDGADFILTNEKSIPTILNLYEEYSKIYL